MHAHLLSQQSINGIARAVPKLMCTIHSLINLSTGLHNKNVTICASLLGTDLVKLELQTAWVPCCAILIATFKLSVNS